MKEKINTILETELVAITDEDGLTINVILKEDLHYTVKKLESFVNQEVERRIKERMLTDEEIEKAFTTEHYHWEAGRHYRVRKDRIFGAKWYRSRLTNPGDSQKTEGGSK